MNLISGTIAEGVFSHAAGRVSLTGYSDGPATIGIRPEDIRVDDSSEHIKGNVFSSELLGDSTLLNVRAGEPLIAVKVGPEDGRAMGSDIGLSFDAAKIHVFDSETGERWQK